MASFVIASTSEAARLQLSRLLSSAGYELFRCCASEGELRRVLAACEESIVILAGRLPGLQAEELQWDYGGRIKILLIEKPGFRKEDEPGKIFHLTMPASGQTILGALEMLTQMNSVQMPRRSGADRQVVEQAKQMLMAELSISEREAHRRMQQYAMNHGIKMTEYAERILRSSRGT